MNQYSLTYLAVTVLTALTAFLGVNVSDDSIEPTASVLVAIFLGITALVGRYRAGKITWYGTRK